MRALGGRVGRVARVGLRGCVQQHRCRVTAAAAPRSQGKVVLGMSGGVDSAVAGALLKRQGYEVEGVFMRNWDAADESGTEVCPADDEWRQVQHLGELLGISCHRVDYSKEYWTDVFESTVQQYDEGLTPNPDVACNTYVKFGPFRQHALTALGADWVATGHYARVVRNEEHRVELHRPRDEHFDQTLFLSQVPHHKLERVLFPLWNWMKDDVRAEAERLGLPNAHQKSSVGMCFIGKRKFQHFLGNYLGANPGPVMRWEDGHVVGQHNGMHNCTIGQRYRLGGLPSKVYVAEKDVANNCMTVVSHRDHPALYSRELHARVHWVAGVSPWAGSSALPDAEVRGAYRLRHAAPIAPCAFHLVRDEGDQSVVRIVLDAPQRAIAPGQVVALYADAGNRLCLGGGPIQHAGPSLAALGQRLPSVFHR